MGIKLDIVVAAVAGFVLWKVRGVLSKWEETKGKGGDGAAPQHEHEEAHVSHDSTTGSSSTGVPVEVNSEAEAEDSGIPSGVLDASNEGTPHAPTEGDVTEEFSTPLDELTPPTSVKDSDIGVEIPVIKEIEEVQVAGAGKVDVGTASTTAD